MELTTGAEEVLMEVGSVFTPATAGLKKDAIDLDILYNSIHGSLWVVHFLRIT
jgi:hypothetical protein